MLDVKDLNIEFHDHLVPETVVHQVNFHMDAGEIVGLVGESGSGKSMTALAIAGLLSRHDMKKTGEILFEGTDLLHCERSFLRGLQGNDISVVFQEPMTSLNPVYRIGWQVEEPLRIHHPELSAQERKQRALTLLKQVELEDPERIYQSYPHQISGGQRQRVMIAAAMHGLDAGRGVADGPEVRKRPAEPDPEGGIVLVLRFKALALIFLPTEGAHDAHAGQILLRDGRQHALRLRHNGTGKIG